MAAGFALVGSCASEEEALGVFANLDPDLVLLVRHASFSSPSRARAQSRDLLVLAARFFPEACKFEFKLPRG